MAIVEQQTLFPGDDFPSRFAPIRMAAADWFTLNGNSSHEILNIGGFGGQLIDLNRVGSLSRSQVNVVIETTRNRQGKGPTDDTARYETEAFAGLIDPIEHGPIGTSGFRWEIEKQNAGNIDPFKTFINYDVRSLTVLDKLRLGIPLQEPTETDLATRRFEGQDFTLRERHNLNLPPARDPIYQPNLEEKIVLEEETAARTLDLTSGQENTIVEENVGKSGGQPQDVIYLTGVSGNWQENATDAEDVTLNLGNAQRKFAEIKTLGLPGASGTVDNESFPAYSADLHVPFLNEMRVWLTTSADINNIDVEVEYVRVDRTLVEKALYGLRDEIVAPSDVTSPSNRRTIRDTKVRLYEQMRERMAAGLPIDVTRRSEPEAEA